MAPQPVKIRADFELTCFASRGIDAIKEALMAGKDKVYNEETFAIQFKIIAPPNYKCEIISLDKKGSISLIEESLEKVEEVIKENGG